MPSEQIDLVDLLVARDGTTEIMARVPATKVFQDWCDQGFSETAREVRQRLFKALNKLNGDSLPEELRSLGIVIPVVRSPIRKAIIEVRSYVKAVNDIFSTFEDEHVQGLQLRVKDLSDANIQAQEKIQGCTKEIEEAVQRLPELECSLRETPQHAPLYEVRKNSIRGLYLRITALRERVKFLENQIRKNESEIEEFKAILRVKGIVLVKAEENQGAHNGAAVPAVDVPRLRARCFEIEGLKIDLQKKFPRAAPIDRVQLQKDLDALERERRGILVLITRQMKWKPPDPPTLKTAPTAAADSSVKSIPTAEPLPNRGGYFRQLQKLQSCITQLKLERTSLEKLLGDFEDLAMEEKGDATGFRDQAERTRGRIFGIDHLIEEEEEKIENLQVEQERKKNERKENESPVRKPRGRKMRRKQ